MLLCVNEENITVTHRTNLSWECLWTINKSYHIVLYCFCYRKRQAPVN